MNILFKLAIFIMFWFVCLLISVGTVVFYHEQTHAMVCELSGGISRVEFNTISTTTCDGGDGDYKLDAVTEIVGYHMIALVSSLYIMLFLLGITIIICTQKDIEKEIVEV